MSHTKRKRHVLQRVTHACQFDYVSNDAETVPLTLAVATFKARPTIVTANASRILEVDLCTLLLGAGRQCC